jgi:hypothetical protein
LDWRDSTLASYSCAPAEREAPAKMNAKPILRGACVLLLVSAFAIACRSSGAHESAQDNGPFRTLLYGYQSGLKPGTIRVVRNAGEWHELWMEHTSSMMPRPDEPTVDWQKEMVVCVALGERPTAGYGVAIDRVERQGNRLIVEAREKKPAPDAIVPQVVTHPYVMAVTPRTDGEVELRMN